MDYLLGRKVGMTQVFSPDGGTIPVTVVEAGPCTVVQRKTKERDGYDAVQLGFLPRKEKRLSKAALGHFKRAGVQPFRILREVPLAEEDAGCEVGSVFGIEIFDRGERLDVSGTTKGKGFAGVMKRHGFSGGPASHGGMFDRLAGSVGASAYPSRIIKGKKMPGHMGDRKTTVQGIMVVDILPEENVVLLRGAVPGGKNSILLLRRSLKGQRGGVEKPPEQVRSVNPLKVSKRAARGA